MNEKKASASTYIGLAGVWFGLHCGGGFATGSQGVIYFTQYGAPVVVSTIISALIMAAYAYVLWDFSRVFKTYDYRSCYNKIFEPYNKVFATIHEILYLLIMVMAMGAVFAGSAELFVNLLGTPFIVGALITSCIIFLLTIFGAEFFFKAASYLSVILVTLLVIICVVGIVCQWDKIGTVISEWHTDYSWLTIIKSAIIYASFQCTVLCGTVSVADGLVTKSDAKKASAMGFLFNGSMMFLIAVMMLGYYPGVVGEPLPVLTILRELDIPILIVAYYTALFISFVTTGITLVFSIVKRFESYGENIIPSLQKRRMIYSIGLIALCFFISLSGLLGIIGKGYGAIGYLGIPLVVIPTLIIGPIKIKKKLSGELSEELNT